ncbi:Hypothetical predicted protein, partial [Olea europaea subsp. europaea]
MPNLGIFWCWCGDDCDANCDGAEIVVAIDSMARNGTVYGQKTLSEEMTPSKSIEQPYYDAIARASLCPTNAMMPFWI